MSTVSQRAKAIAKRLDRMKRLLENNFPPAMTGTPKDDFVDDANTNEDQCGLQLADPLLSGFTPSLVTQPTGTDMMDWFVDMGDDAKAIVDDPNATSTQLQEAADNYYTIEQGTDDLITAYT